MNLQRILTDIGIDMGEREVLKIRSDFESKFKDGKVPMSELESYLVSYLSDFSESSLSAALSWLDADKDGKISVDEFTYYMENFGEKLKP